MPPNSDSEQTPADPTASDAAERGVQTDRFLIVGIGASAGGLGAFEAFFSGMPADQEPGMAFVVIQHLSPDHSSMLAELIQRHTRMKVFEITDGMRVLPNCAYIIPPSKELVLGAVVCACSNRAFRVGSDCPSMSFSVR